MHSSMVNDIHGVWDFFSLHQWRLVMAELGELCEELDRTLLELMDGLKALSSLRNKYRDAVKEVGII